MAIPCSAKLEMKDSFQIEINQQVNTVKHKVSCTIYKELKQTTTKENVQKSILPFFNASTPVSIFIVVNKIKLPDFFKAQKEKIPTYLSIDQFLI